MSSCTRCSGAGQEVFGKALTDGQIDIMGDKHNECSSLMIAVDDALTSVTKVVLIKHGVIPADSM